MFVSTDTVEEEIDWTTEVLTMLNDMEEYGEKFIIKKGKIIIFLKTYACLLKIIFTEKVDTSIQNMPNGSTYLFICFFVLLFQLEYLTFTATHKLLDLFRVLFTELNFPKAIPTIKNQTGFTSLTKDIVIYAACPKCYSIYMYSTNEGLCIPGPPQICSYIHVLKKKNCNTPLFKNGSNIPLKKFVYHCLISSIQKLFLRQGFEEKCEEWRDYEEAISDNDIIYHCSQAKMWRNIKSSSGDPFVNDERSLCLTLNAGKFFFIEKKNQ